VFGLFVRVFVFYVVEWPLSRKNRNLYIYRRFKEFMFEWLFGKRSKVLHEHTKKGFDSVKKDFEHVGEWIKHLDSHDKQLFDLINGIKLDLSSVREEVDGLREALDFADFGNKNKQLLEKTGVLKKQTAVYPVEESVQTPVQTGNLYDILNNFSSNERLLIFALLNAGEGMKLSYEDLARLLGKERSTVRGQINAIKQKSEGLLEEIVEPNGKKRVFIHEEVRNKLLKYAKVRVKEGKKVGKNDKKKEKRENWEVNEEMVVESES
jgi:hypothetical protein